jgi:hypothetical protein
MGRQIRFFMLNSDEEKFLEYVKESGAQIFDKKSNPIEIDKFGRIIEDKDQPSITQLFITSPESKIRKDENGFIDQILSDVIVFRRCSLTEKKMVWEGRIWAEFKYYDDRDELIKKEKWFEQKFNKYRSWIKKNFRISIDKFAYIGEEAYNLYKEKGYRMMNGPKVEIKF